MRKKKLDPTKLPFVTVGALRFSATLCAKPSLPVAIQAGQFQREWFPSQVYLWRTCYYENRVERAIAKGVPVVSFPDGEGVASE